MANDPTLTHEEQADFVKTLLKLSHPSSFRPTLEENPELLDAFEAALKMFELNKEDFFKDAFAGPADQLEALRSYRGKQSAPENLKVEFLLAGPDIYSRQLALIDAEEKHDRQKMITMAESIYNTIDSKSFPLIYSLVATSLASNIAIISSEDQSYDPEQAIQIFEEVLSLSLDQDVILNARQNLLRLYFNSKKWAEPEQRERKAFEHGTALLNLLSSDRALVTKAGSESSVLEDTLDMLIIICKRMAIRYENNFQVGMEWLKKGAALNERFLSVVKEKQSSRSWLTWPMGKQHIINDKINEINKSKSEIEASIRYLKNNS